MGFNFPSSPTIGQLYPATLTPGLPQYSWDGEKWVIASNVNGPTIFVSDSPPSLPPDGALWWRSDIGVLYVRFRDADGVQWVAAAAPAVGAQGPPGPWVQITQAAYNALSPPLAGVLYIIIG
jgi:hypothetical protein